MGEDLRRLESMASAYDDHPLGAPLGRAAAEIFRLRTHIAALQAERAKFLSDATYQRARADAAIEGAEDLRTRLAAAEALASRWEGQAANGEYGSGWYASHARSLRNALGRAADDGAAEGEGGAG